jgi:hypothetical protein
MASLRIKNLESLDPRAVPLPNGTEVTTGADRLTADGTRVVRQGAIGRVTATSTEGIIVVIVGVGECTYQRHELTPHRMGQLRYALEREASEQALRGCVVLEATVGSRAWGLSDPLSDTDHKGVFLLPFTWTNGIGDAPSTLMSADGSDTYWEYDKTIRQLLRADPNTMEMVWVSEIRVTDPCAEALIQHRDAFSSVEVYGTFGRYAIAQARKLSQSARLAEHRAVVLAWLRDAPTLTLDAVSHKLAERALDATPDGVQRCRQYVKQLYRSMHDQGILAAADFESLVRFAVERSMDFDLPRELRPKNAYNLLRLVASATHFLRTGAPLIRVEGPLREKLLRIKKGEVALEDSLAWAEELSGELEEARAHTVLPRRPDVQRADALLRAARQEAARRWFQNVDGPWGRDAPQPPSVQHEQEIATPGATEANAPAEDPPPA